ncbi:cation:proton antiporter [Roseisolibacter sp. H3M3-2]|uniref:cation:proton antiporter n=1 Tax=Roseisolibacter sp. H3M3-2 TaxID=3031323 RepID=UPI0023D9FE22|nr:cation:proton antiporter [Roseisolibacter sp. H3M3-2]MDF1504019.1 cation:proton antiporter [Roseisolibacter sp. H3M3-2]
MIVAAWFAIVGVVLVLTSVVGSTVQRLPLTTTLLYLAIGAALGPLGVGMLHLDAIEDARILERLSEIAVLVSLFAGGLKLRAALRDRRWATPVRLATLVMVLTVGLLAVAGVLLLRLPLGAAVLLGAILAPTDPVLASDVQLEHAADRDRLRFALTGEAALNDGAAFPFVMLGLGLLGVHDLGAWGWRWLAVDVVWAGAAGLLVGYGLGWAVSRVVLWLRRERREALGLDDLLALGLIALAYGAALMVKGYGFLAVFAAGFALRREERRATETLTGADAPPDVAAAALAAEDADEVATAPDTAPAYMAQAALGFTEQLERLAEVAIVLLVGGLLSTRTLAPEALWFVPLLFLVVRPLAVLVGAPMRGAPRMQRALTMWFGIRGVGSIYYFAYAVEHGLPRALADRMAGLVLACVAASVVLHGISVTPLMRRYEARS